MKNGEGEKVDEEIPVGLQTEKRATHRSWRFCVREQVSFLLRVKVISTFQFNCDS